MTFLMFMPRAGEGDRTGTLSYWCKLPLVQLGRESGGNSKSLNNPDPVTAIYKDSS